MTFGSNDLEKKVASKKKEKNWNDISYNFSNVCCLPKLSNYFIKILNYSFFYFRNELLLNTDLIFFKDFIYVTIIFASFTSYNVQQSFFYMKPKYNVE